VNAIDNWYLENLVCPRENSKLTQVGNTLISETGSKYPIVNGIPIMLLTDVEQTIELANKTLDRHTQIDDIYFLETLGITTQEIKELTGYINRGKLEDFEVDPVVQFLVGATNGNLYKDAIGKLKRYPIPDIRLPEVDKKTLLDIGCSWGRWCVAAAQKGYMAIGLDPSLGAVLAGQRVARKLNLDVKFVVGDARYLPFRTDCFDQIFSYSVLQHFSKSNVRSTLTQIDRVLKINGKSLIQMPNCLGLRSLQHQANRGFKDGDNFDVRYWSIRELTQYFTEEVGSSKISIDGFFGLGIQGSDVDLLPFKYKMVVGASAALRKISRFLPILKYFADSVYVESFHKQRLR